MSKIYVRKATIKAKVLKTRKISEREMELQVLIKEIVYETMNCDTGECKNGEIILKEFSERGAFIVKNWMLGQDFVYTASQFVRDDVVVFSIMYNGANNYLFTSLKFDCDFYEGNKGLFSLVEKYKGI